MCTKCSYFAPGQYQFTLHSTGMSVSPGQYHRVSGPGRGQTGLTPCYVRTELYTSLYVRVHFCMNSTGQPTAVTPFSIAFGYSTEMHLCISALVQMHLVQFTNHVAKLIPERFTNWCRAVLSSLGQEVQMHTQMYPFQYSSHILHNHTLGLIPQNAHTNGRKASPYC